MPIEMRMPVVSFGAAAGRITRTHGARASPRACARTFSQSLLTDATPCAVLISIGHSEQMKITNTPETDES